MCLGAMLKGPRMIELQNERASRQILWIIFTRAIILLLTLNLAEAMGILPPRIGSLPFLPLFNMLTVSLALLYLALWRSGHNVLFQLCLQIGVDLCLTTLLVALTHGIESAFVSFYLLIITFCSLTLGRSGGLVAASLSLTLYSGIIFASQTGIIIPREIENPKLAIFRTSAHALGFFAVAFLGTDLSQRLRAVQRELQEKIDSLKQLQKLNENIVSSMRSGLMTTDLTGRIAVFNNAASEITGKSQAEVFETGVQAIFGEAFWN